MANLSCNHALREQRQGPALTALRGGAARFGDQAGFSFGIQLRLLAGTRALIKCREVFLDEALARALDRGTTDGEGFCDARILPALRGFEQNAGAGYFASRGRAAA